MARIETLLLFLIPPLAAAQATGQLSPSERIAKATGDVRTRVVEHIARGELAEAGDLVRTLADGLAVEVATCCLELTGIDLVDPLSLVLLDHDYDPNNGAFLQTGQPTMVDTHQAMLTEIARQDERLRPFIADALLALIVHQLRSTVARGESIVLSDQVLLASEGPFTADIMSLIPFEVFRTCDAAEQRFSGSEIGKMRGRFTARFGQGPKASLWISGLWQVLLRTAIEMDGEVCQRWLPKIDETVGELVGRRQLASASFVVGAMSRVGLVDSIGFLRLVVDRLDPNDAEGIANAVVALGMACRELKVRQMPLPSTRSGDFAMLGKRLLQLGRAEHTKAVLKIAGLEATDFAAASDHADARLPSFLVDAVGQPPAGSMEHAPQPHLAARVAAARLARRILYVPLAKAQFPPLQADALNAASAALQKERTAQGQRRHAISTQQKDLAAMPARMEEARKEIERTRGQCAQARRKALDDRIQRLGKLDGNRMQVTDREQCIADMTRILIDSAPDPLSDPKFATKLNVQPAPPAADRSLAADDALRAELLQIGKERSKLLDHVEPSLHGAIERFEETLLAIGMATHDSDQAERVLAVGWIQHPTPKELKDSLQAAINLMQISADEDAAKAERRYDQSRKARKKR